MSNQKWLKVQRKINVWEQFHIRIPDGMTAAEFSEFLEANDPSLLMQEPDEIEFLFDTERVLRTEVFDPDYDEDMVINFWDHE